MALCDKGGRERSRLIGEPLGDSRTRFKLCGHQGGSLWAYVAPRLSEARTERADRPRWLSEQFAK